MGKLKRTNRILLMVLMIIFVLIFSSVFSVRAEEPIDGARTVNEGENQDGENNAEGENSNPEGNPLEGIDLSGIEGAQGAEGLLGGMTGEGQEEEGPKNIVERLDITAHLNHDGSATMTEVWKTNMITGTDMTRIYTDFSSYKASNLSVEDKTTGRRYTYVENWNSLTDKADKDDKCGIIDLGSIVNICWGIGEYGTHEYIVRYDIENFVKDYSSYQLVYLKILQDNMDPAPGKAKVMVYSDFDLKEDEVSVSGYGFIGKSELQSNGYAVFETNGSLEQIGYMTIFLRFEGTPFEAKPAIVLDLETIRNNANNEAEVQTESEPDENKKELSVGMIIGIVVGSVVLVAAIIIVIAIIVRKKKRREKLKAKRAAIAAETEKNDIKEEHDKDVKNKEKK